MSAGGSLDPASFPVWDLQADPLGQHVPLPYRFDGGALGVGLRVETNDPAMLALAETAFGRFGRPENGQIDIKIEIVAQVSSGLPLDAPSALLHRERGTLYGAADERGSVVVADLEAGRAAAFVAGETPPEVVRTVLLESPVWRMAAWRGLVALHAAAVVVRGRTLVLRGSGGSGKSTLVYAAARAGHAVLAEEVTWFDPTGPALALRGAPWTVSMEADARRLFPELADHPETARAGGRPKLAVDVGQATGAPCVECAALGPMVFLERASRDAPFGRGASGAGWTRLGAEEARSRFEAALLPAERTQRRDRLDGARDALVAAGAFVLRFEGPAAAIAALEGLADPSPYADGV